MKLLKKSFKLYWINTQRGTQKMPCDAHLSALEVVLSRSGNDANAVSIYYYEQNRRLGGGHPKTQTRRSKRKLLVQSIPPLPIDT